MYLYGGIVSVIVGIVIFTLGITKILPHTTTSGFALFAFGLLLIGFNFIPVPEKEEGVQEMSFGAKLLNIFVSPSEVFRNFRSHPTWLGAILIAAIVTGIYSTAFLYRLTPEVINNHTISKMSESGFVQPDQIAEIKKNSLEAMSSKVAQGFGFVNTFVVFCFLFAFFAVIYFLTCLAMGGKMNYWQALATTAWAVLPVMLIQKLLSLLILFLKEPSEIHPILGQQNLLMDNLSFFVAPANNPVLYTLLASISLTAIYGLFLTAIGLKNAGYKVSSAAGWVAAFIVYFLMLSLGLISALLFGSFMS